MSQLSLEKNRKNILLVVRHPVGGIKTYLKYVLKKNYFRDYDFVIVSPDHEIANNPDAQKDDSIKIKSISCEDNAISLFLTLIPIFWNNRFDLIHSHGFTSAICSILLSRLSFTPHILTVHDVLLESQYQGPKGAIKKRLLSFLFNRVDLIQSVSHDAENNLKQMLPKIQTHKLVTILNGIDIHQFSNSDVRNLKSELDLDGHFLIGFLGRFMSQKGFKYLVNAIEILNQDESIPLKPTIVSVGSGGFIREEKEMIKNRKLENRFVFLPAVNDVGPTLKGVDVVCIPSLWEACPLLPMEVLVCGVPLIASDCIGLREVIADSPAIVVPVKNSEALAIAIKKRILDNERCEFETYRKTARQKFDSSHTSIKLLELYQQLIVN